MGNYLFNFLGIDPKTLHQKLHKKHKHLNVYLKEDMPSRFFYSNNRRIAPLIAYADPQWLIAKNQKAWSELSRFPLHCSV